MSVNRGATFRRRRERLLKNSDNTSPGCGLHLNVCIHTLSCIALTRGVVKIIQTDPDSFFLSVWDTF